MVAASDDHGEQARVDRRLLRDTQMDRRAGIRAAARISDDRLRTAPRWTGDVSVIHIHEQSPSEACPIGGRFALVRTEPLPACSTQAASGRSSDPAAAGRPMGSMPYSVYNLPTNPRARGADPLAGLRTANGLWHTPSAGTKQMVTLDDTVGAFVPGPRLERPPLGERTSVRPQLRREGPVRRRRQRHDLWQPGLGGHPSRRRSRPPQS